MKSGGIHRRALAWTLGITLLLACRDSNAQVPSGFSESKSWKGVTVYKDSGNTNYLTVVDLKKARLVSLTGSVTNAPNGIFGKKSMSEHQSAAVSLAGTTRIVTVVINGAFFIDTSSNPTTALSHGLKAFGKTLSKGSDLRGGVLLIDFEPQAARINIGSYGEAKFSSSVPEVIGAHTVSENKDSSLNRQRTFLGISDSDGDGTYDRVYLLSSKGVTQPKADQMVRNFGATSTAMLDGGTSTGLVLDGAVIISGRTVPHAIGVLAPK